MTELQQTIETAYRVFADYEARGRLEVCRCNVCVTPEAERLLVQTPLRTMPAAVLAEYTHSAHEWSQQVSYEFRHFLPRYLDLIAAGDPPSTIGVETCLDRLHAADFRHAWPRDEVDAIDAWFLALLRMLLAMPVRVEPFGVPAMSRDPVECMLCMAAHAGADLAGLLAGWAAERGREATLHIAAIVAGMDWRKQRLVNSFWSGYGRDDLDRAMHEVMAWLLRAQTRERLERACLAEIDGDAAALLSHAEGLVAARL